MWDDVTLTIAEAIRKGEAVARVPLPEQLAAKGLADPSVGQWLNRLRDDVDVIHIELLDQELQAGADRELDEEAEQLVERARRLRRRHGGGETLHSAFDAHSKWIEQTYLGMDGRLDAWGSTQKRQVDFLLRHLPDCALVELTAHHIDELLNVLRLRPIRENGQRVSASSAKNLIKQFRSFLRWLNKCPDYSWRRPPDYETTPLRVVRTSEEKSSLRRHSQVDVYNIDELQTLYEYAKPLQRVFMLIALNCGFGRAELASLGLDEVYLHKRHPHEREVGYVSSGEDSWVFRLRQKTGVYGEYKLWPVTVTAIEWWLRQRSQIAVPPDVSTLLVTRKGNRYDTPTKGNHTNFQLPNTWYNLTKRIQKDHKDFRSLSFNKLRKTAGNLIRQQAGGEVAGVFLCHGRPVSTDDQLDLYTNRPFARVFEAIDLVGQQLHPVWSAVEQPFPEVQKKGGPNISPAKIRKIQRMRRAGFKVARIAEEVGVDRTTVYRWGKGAIKARDSNN